MLSSVGIRRASSRRLAQIRCWPKVVSLEPCRREVSMSGASKPRSEEHTSELQSLMRISYAVFCLKKKKNQYTSQKHHDDNRTSSINQHTTNEITSQMNT